MIQMNSRITINTGFLKQLNEAAAKALEKTGEALHTEVVQAQVMPRDTGALQNEKSHVKAGETVTAQYADGKTASTTITKESGGIVSLITTSPQARRLYYHPEYNFQTHENPNAGGEWFKPWLPGGVNEDFAREAFRKLYKREAGL